ncbi:MAG: cardiolipin synthase [Muribaculum sp.]
MAWYYIVLLAAYIGTIISLIAVVLSENRNPVKSLAWITVLLMVPVFGAVLYIFFGRSLKNTRMITRRNRRRLRKRESFKSIDIASLPLTQASKQQIKMARTLNGSIYYPDNKIDIFTSGRDKFDALIADLQSARSYIHLEYYIFKDDKIGNTIADILIKKAGEGVKVRIIYDHIGSLSTKTKFFKRMADAGIDVYPFFRVTFPVFATRINWRNHRKIVIIDGETGYIGGMNIADRYIEGVSYGVWRDTHVRIKGPAVGGLQYAFAVDWSFMGQSLLDESANTSRRNKPRFNSGIQMMTSGPTSQWSNIAMVFQKAIANARKRVFIQTPYFLPTESLLRTLQTVALAKVDVRLMLPAKSDSKILTYASYSYIMECMLAGIKVYLYDAGMLHAKTVIVDDEFSSVGSANIDFRSFEHNFESNIFIYSREVNSELSDIFFEDLDNCTRLSPSMWRKRPAWQKAKESMFRLLSPVL